MRGYLLDLRYIEPEDYLVRSAVAAEGVGDNAIGQGEKLALDLLENVEFGSHNACKYTENPFDVAYFS